MSKDGVRTFVTVVLALAIGAAGIAYGRFVNYKAEQIRAGPAFDARAVNWDTHRSRRQLGYKIKYEFTLEGVTYISDWATVPQDVHDATRAGAPVAVRRAAARPEWHLPEVSIAGVEGHAVWAQFAGVLAVLLGIVGAVVPWVVRRRQAKAAAALSAQHVARRADNFPKDPPPA